MKPNMPRSWNQLPKREQEELKKFMTEAATETAMKIVQKEESELQKRWLKMACIVNYEAWGHAEKRATIWLANWRRIYRQVAKCKTDEELLAMLEKRLAKVFPHGFPDEYLDSLERIGGDNS